MPTKVGLRAVKDKLTAGVITHDDGITKFSITNNVENKLGLSASQRVHDNKTKTITFYIELDTLNKMLHTLGYEIERLPKAEKKTTSKTTSKTKTKPKKAKTEPK